MRKIVIILCLVGSGIIILDTIQIVQALAIFILGGSVPGTSLILSPSQMLTFFAASLGFVISRIWINSHRRVVAMIHTRRS